MEFVILNHETGQYELVEADAPPCGWAKWVYQQALDKAERYIDAYPDIHLDLYMEQARREDFVRAEEKYSSCFDVIAFCKAKLEGRSTRAGRLRSERLADDGF